MKITKLKKVDNIIFKQYKNITSNFKKSVIERNFKVVERDWFKYDGKLYQIGKQNPDNIRLRPNNDKNVKLIARWLQNELGGKVFINPEPISDPFRVSDFMYRNQKWELKTYSKENKKAVFNEINRGKGQANNFIIDFSNSPLTYEEMLNQVDYTFKRNHINWFRKLIIKQRNRYDVFIRQ